MTIRLSPATRLGLLMAGLSLASKLLILRYGLPFEFNPDEPYILKEPFKLTYLYSHGVFQYPTNFFFWILQLWYGVLWLAGLLASHWNSVADFKAALAVEAEVLLLWGRLLGALASAGAVFVLTRLIVRTTSGWGPRVLMAGSLALNPVDLVATPWLKFDGVVALANAFLLVAFVTYLASKSDRDRGRMYVLAIVACALRIDLIVFALVLLIYDWRHKRPFRRVLKPALAGIGLYCLITLQPIVTVYQWVAPSWGGPVISVGRTFEEHIFDRFVVEWKSGVLWHNPASGVAFYTPILLSVGLPFVILAWPGFRRNANARLMLGLSIGMFLMLMSESALATRYAALISVYLLLGAGWAIQELPRRSLRLGLAIGCLAIAASLTAETVWAIRTQADPRIGAADYLISQSGPSDLIAVEEYINPGRHAEVSECPDELRKKAAATIESRSGTGETFAAWATRPAPDCRRILEVAETDRFAGSSYRGRWINTYDSDAWARMVPQPLLFTTNVSYETSAAQSRHPLFSEFVQRHYHLVRTFETRYRDPRLRALLKGTPYYARLYVYRRRS